MPSYIVALLVKSVLRSHRYTGCPVPALVIQGIGPLKFPVFPCKVSALAMHKARIIFIPQRVRPVRDFPFFHSFPWCRIGFYGVLFNRSFLRRWLVEPHSLFHAHFQCPGGIQIFKPSMHCPQRKLRRTSYPPINVSSYASN